MGWPIGGCVTSPYLFVLSASPAWIDGRLDVLVAPSSIRESTHRARRINNIAITHTPCTCKKSPARANTRARQRHMADPSNNMETAGTWALGATLGSHACGQTNKIPGALVQVRCSPSILGLQADHQMDAMGNTGDWTETCNAGQGVPMETMMIQTGGQACQRAGRRCGLGRPSAPSSCSTQPES